jgi:hypothetical protein
MLSVLTMKQLPTLPVDPDFTTDVTLSALK